MFSSNQWIGPSLVALAAFLWATDAVVRYPAISSMDPTFLVFMEHILGVLILFPWVWIRNRRELFSFQPREWASAAFSGMAGSALGTILFTASFYYVNPSVAVLLQKLQPILVILIAFLFLGERPTRKFFLWGGVALLAGIVLSFPDLKFDFLKDGSSQQAKGIQYALAAALIWAASTVSGKILLTRSSAAVATFWRFFFGFIALTALLILSPETRNGMNFDFASSIPAISALLYLSLVPGLFAMLIYYQGLSRTRASVTTFIELLYPVGAVILNTIFLHTPLNPTQALAGGILLVSVSMISK